MGFGIHADFNGNFRVCITIDKGMTIAIQMLNYRHASIITDTLNQAFTATRHNHIDKFSHGD